jgi:uncharacterized protein
MKNDLDDLCVLIAPLFIGLSGGPFTVYLYGSRAMGRAGPESDHDFALIAPEPIARDELERIRDRLFDLLGDVDCVDMRRISLALAAQVLESGMVLIPGDEGERAMLETRLMSMYAALNEEREGIIADIVERGSVYAR